MNPMIMLYSLTAMADATPAVPVLTQPVAVTANVADSLTPPVITDDLLLRWHSALIHFGDTLIVHPELQQIAELKPLLRHYPQYCGTWIGLSPNASAELQVVDSLLRNVKSSDKTTFGRQAGLPNFPAEDIVKAIAQKPALVGAISAAKLTPREFVATTSALEQEECAARVFFTSGPDGPLFPGIDSTSTLGKNIQYFYKIGARGLYSRHERISNTSLDSFLFGIKDKDRNEMLKGYKDILKPDGTEKPLE